MLFTSTVRSLVHVPVVFPQSDTSVTLATIRQYGELTGFLEADVSAANPTAGSTVKAGQTAGASAVQLELPSASRRGRGQKRTAGTDGGTGADTQEAKPAE